MNKKINTVLLTMLILFSLFFFPKSIKAENNVPEGSSNYTNLSNVGGINNSDNSDTTINLTNPDNANPDNEVANQDTDNNSDNQTVDPSLISIHNSDVKMNDFVVYSREVLEQDQAIYPDFKVVVNGKKLKINQDYSAVAENADKAGNAKLIITGKGNYTGTVTRNYKIRKDNISTGSYLYFYTKNYKYTSSGKKFKFKLESKPEILLHNRTSTAFYQEGRDYVVNYSEKGNKGTLTITGINNYAGTVKIPYCINTWIKNKNYFSKNKKDSAKKENKKFFWKKSKFSKDNGVAFYVIVTKTKNFNKCWSGKGKNCVLLYHNKKKGEEFRLINGKMGISHSLQSTNSTVDNKY